MFVCICWFDLWSKSSSRWRLVISRVASSSAEFYTSLPPQVFLCVVIQCVLGSTSENPWVCPAGQSNRGWQSCSEEHWEDSRVTDREEVSQEFCELQNRESIVCTIYLLGEHSNTHQTLRPLIVTECLISSVSTKSCISWVRSFLTLSIFRVSFVRVLMPNKLLPLN